MVTKLNLLKKLFGKNKKNNSNKFKVDKIKTTYPLIL